ncbi:PREDICTED: putative ATP-dependent DNA helicase Q1 [Nicrophorus vespilloides]|uniref:ATP-dependent DNA helicase n=1 Tax=Nicrophorus vespilloides TaxID=110193 RepID=A0ABM1MB02_NICVS|nr:PREDICTED: putative ATP-dependent DNA helicase Q1 [Nicrophorus vespilloides]XP_017771752.1 PREDICTED: putative ATP-dependent DNA helicase Q1 [Nicrophorus vespilloides]
MDDVAEKIELIDIQLAKAISKRGELNRLIARLKQEKDELQSNYNLKKSLDIDDNWTKTNFPWSKELQNNLEKTFHLKSFRSQQICAINATLSNKDVLLLMPTGGGKTLCYQLPALIGKGMTLVISPLLALMEDQLIKLKKLGINSISMSSGTPKEIKNQGFQYLSKGVGNPIKFMYVTPEWLAKSKKFMSGLQKLHEAKKLDRIAIDEVHCCSQWGHDFRPDYKYLGLLKGMFSDVPIIGLTATATTSVLLDIQNMLDIPGCAIIRAPFDRPNLKFKVVAKPDKSEECLSLLEKLLTKKYKDECGIIYTATIKDCEEVTKGLMARGLKVKHYHAELPDERRTKTHNSWLKDDVRVIVATVAFGMGIDKADVRFVVHYSVPKSMETLYQESGRAGRDGKNAECVVMFKLSDYLKNSGYARSKTEIKNALSVLEYCLDKRNCRHYLIGLHFEESKIKSCNTMCDNCDNKSTLETYDIKEACSDVYQILEHAAIAENNLTANKLIDLWMKPKIKIKKPNISKEEAEYLVGHLILKGCLREEKSYTPYSVNCYLRKSHSTSQIEVVLNASASLDNYLKRKRKVIEIDDSEDETNSKSKSKKSK